MSLLVIMMTAALAQDADLDGWDVAVGDCDDNNRDVHPGALEMCDGVDNDCDPLTPEWAAPTWYRDADGDGWGLVSEAVTQCSVPPNHSDMAGDCDDEDPLAYPGADEACTLTDRNCNGLNLDGISVFRSVWWDLDHDGFGAGDLHHACESDALGGGWVVDLGGGAFVETDEVSLEPGDCNDEEPYIHPGFPEFCDGIDNNCDEQIDELGAIGEGSDGYYVDADGDNFGAGELVQSCEPLDGYAIVGGDCFDLDPNTHPYAVEICDEADNDCDGVIDNDCVADALPLNDDSEPTAQDCGCDSSPMFPSALLAWVGLLTFRRR